MSVVDAQQSKLGRSNNRPAAFLRRQTSLPSGRLRRPSRRLGYTVGRTIRAPIDRVFARLVDIEGHNDWMAGTGSMLKHTRQTSPGEPAVGTTFVDETSQGPMPGEIVEMEAPHTIVYHWWEKSKSGKLKFEGWPSYDLEPSGDTDLASIRCQGTHHHSRCAQGVL